MSDNVENLVLEHLRHIRAKVDQIADDVNELKHLTSSVESSMAFISTKKPSLAFFPSSL